MRVLNAFRAATPLIINGYALVANVGVSSILGIVFWMLATRLYTQDQVGLAAALISLMTTISYFSQMNLSSFLTRFIPMAQAGTGRLILKSYAVAGAMAALVSAAFALTAGSIAEPLQVIRGSPVALALFVAATVAWTIFSLQDAALSGLRRSVLVPVENAIYSVLKICFLVLLANLVLPLTGGIFLAWILPLLPLTIVINAMIFWRLPREGLGPKTEIADLRTVTRFLGWDFFGSLALSAAYGIAPLIVTASAGVSSTATYHLAWSIAYSIHLVGMAMSVALLAEGVTNPVRLRKLIVDTLCHSLLLSLGAVVVIMAAAPLIMGMFGRAYVSEGAPVLRILALSCLPWTVSTIYCAAARVRGQTRSVAFVQLGTLIVFVAASAVLVGSYGALGVAYGWLLAHSAACAGVIIAVLMRDGRSTFLDWLLALGNSAMQLCHTMIGLRQGTGGTPNAIAKAFLSDTGHVGITRATPLMLEGSLSDITTILLKADEPQFGEVNAVMKCATSDHGVELLHRNAKVLKSLAADERLAKYHPLIPKIIHEETTRDGFHTIETAVPGVEGLRLLQASGDWMAAMATTASTLAELHRRTSTLCLLDDEWAKQWIDKPVMSLSKVGAFRSRKCREEDFENLRRALRNVFVGRQVHLGLGHGDLWPGNLFFSQSDDKKHRVSLTGLAEWESSRADSMACLDACHLGLTFRMVRNGEEFGPVVRDFLRNGGWTPEEVVIFGNAGYRAGFDDAADCPQAKAIVVLTWLHHVATRLEKSDKSSRVQIWLAMHVDRVLDMIAQTSLAIRK
jgi:O-antigen/teichoic acid export membrane protein/thiamine kinase-like enzyme